MGNELECRSYSFELMAEDVNEGGLDNENSNV